MENLLISVIIPVYNAEQFLGQCLDSILQQTYSNLEVICVDDGSTDASLSICQQYSEKDRRVQVIHKDNEGVSCARNKGIACAQGQFVFFVDADDCLDKNALKACVIHQSRTNTIVALNYDRISKEEQKSESSCVADILKIPFIKLKRRQVLDIVVVRRGWYIWGMLIPKVLIDRYQLNFPEKICNLEDAAWIGMALCYVENIVFIGAELYHYRENPVSITSNCVDYSWQAEHWIKVYWMLVDYFAGIKKNNYRRIYIQKMLRYCKNNFYAECYAGEMNFRNVDKIYRLTENRGGHAKYPEYFAYNCYFMIRRIVNIFIKKIRKVKKI